MARQKGKGLILYADDSKVEQELFRQALKEKTFSFHVEFFNNGEDLIKYLEKVEPEDEELIGPFIIILDWEMPKKSGYETLKTLKAHKFWQLIPVLIFSSHDDPEIIQAAYTAYANAYIKKPRDYDEFPVILDAIENFWIKKVLYAYNNEDL